jgi:iron complex outermembrane receptor protein
MERSWCILGRSLVVAGCFIAGAQPLPAGSESAAADSSTTAQKEIFVNVTRAVRPATRLPASVHVLGRQDIRGAQSTLGLDEALNNLPGIYVSNRYNYSLDQRLSIRSFGLRSNFGTRGTKVLLDGIPQTLPDGQSQLTNVDFGNLERIEVLHGASSSLYGNASGGVLLLESEHAGPEMLSQSLRTEGGSFGLFKIQARTTARRGRASGVLSLSRTQLDGFRDHSAAEINHASLVGDIRLSAITSLGIRTAYSGMPLAENPGALTTDEVLESPGSAAPANIVRGANKDVSQGQLGLILTRTTDRREFRATVFGFVRELENPLATPPGAGAPPDQGLWQSIDRQAYGARLDVDQSVGAEHLRLKVTAGVDLQRMRDDRTTYRTIQGEPDSVTVEQREIVQEIGPFVQLNWGITEDVLVSTGTRYDVVEFDVADHLLDDGIDDGGNRVMSAWSGNAGLSYVRHARFSPYVNVSTNFETPTTTELANQPNSAGGFNNDLNPQRAVSYEMGVRGLIGRGTYSVAGFIGRIEDAIVQYREVSGRAYFTNAARVRNNGVELGLTYPASDRLRCFGSLTLADYRYESYRLVNGAETDTLDGNRLPGAPKTFARVGLRANPFTRFSIEVDHTMASSIFADDRNTLMVSGWDSAGPRVPQGMGTGITNARFAWEAPASWLRVFAGVNNVWDREYVSALTLNGALGRVFEPASGRNWYLGADIGWAKQSGP